MKKILYEEYRCSMDMMVGSQGEYIRAGARWVTFSISMAPCSLTSFLRVATK